MTTHHSDFHKLFAGLDRAYGTYKVIAGEDQKIKGEARTHLGTVTDELWELHLSGKQGLGIIPITDDATCLWGAIDIDVYASLDIVAIELKIESARLPLVLCKTKSGGLHLYIFLKKNTSAELVRSKLVRWAYFLGFPTAEVFPKQIKLASQDDVGNWLNMPYFNGNDTDRFCIKSKKNLSVSEFLKYALEKRISKESLQELILTYDDLVIDAPPCIQHLSETKVQQGGRNNALFSYAVYAKKKWPDEWERRTDKFNMQFIDPPLKSRLTNAIINSHQKKDYFYKCEDIPINNICNKALCLNTPFGIGTKEDDPGVVMTELTKIDTNPPLWILVINDSRVQMETTNQLLDQGRFRTLCVEALNLLPRKIKPDSWDDLIRVLLDGVIIIDTPDDAEEKGQLWILIENFLTNSSTRGNHQEELLNGKVWQKDNLLYFRSFDLIHYLESNRIRGMKVITNIWNELRRKGAISDDSTRFKIKGKQVRCWALPTHLFSFQEEEFTVQVPKKEF